MSNFVTVKDARDFCGRFVDNGACQPSVIDDRVFEACRRLMAKADWVFTTRLIRARVAFQHFPLPREAEAIRWANICGAPARVFGPAYEFVWAGPGEIKHMVTQTGFKNLVDAGPFCTMYDIPPIETFAATASPVERTLGEGFYLAAFSTQDTDGTKEVVLRGLDKYDAELGASSEFAPTESLRITPWQHGIEGSISTPWSKVNLTTRRYRQLTDWTKPVTGGHISLYAVNPDTNYVYLLAKAHPLDTKPLWRRYKIAGQALPGQADHANILMLCKLRALPFTADDEVLPIQNLDAVKAMVMAIKLENEQNLTGAQAYEATAVRLLNEQQANVDVNAGMPTIIDHQMETTGVCMGTRPI